MKKINISSHHIFLIGLLLTTNFFWQDTREDTSMQNAIQLPSPKYKSNTSIEEALLRRRSIRDYRNEQLSLSEVSQILWAAQGITDKAEGLRRIFRKELKNWQMSVDLSSINLP